MIRRSLISTRPYTLVPYTTRCRSKARGARIYAEIIGFGCNADGDHATHPNQETMGGAMQLALDDAGISTADIGYVSCHGTATEQGDIAERSEEHTYELQSLMRISYAVF